MEIAREVKVDVLHGHDLRIAAPGRAPLDPEAGAKARLPNADHGLLADQIERVGQPHGGGGLALARGRGRDRRDQDELAIRLVGQRRQIIERNLRLIVAVGQHMFRRDAEPVSRHLDDRPHLRRLADLDVGFRLLVLLVGMSARFFGTLTRLD